MVGLLAAAFLAPAALPPLEIALGEAAITGTERLPLGGYTERGDRLGIPGPKPLRARLALLRQGDQEVVLGALEMLTLPESLRDAIQEAAGPRVRLFLGATHTHSSPDSQMFNDRMTFRIPGISPFKRREMERVAGIVAGAIRKLRTGPFQRVSRLEVESWPAQSNRARRQGGRPDPTVWMIKVNGRDLLGIYSAHPTFHEAKDLDYSGDWPGVWMDEGPWIALTGAIGDVSPSAEGKTPEEKSRALVENLGETRVDMGKNGRKLPLRIEVNMPMVLLPKPVPHPEFATANKVSPALATLAVGRFAPPDMKLTLLSLGGFLLVGVPGEPTSGVARKLRMTAQMEGFPRAAVLSHINGWGGYMLEADDYARGGYEATLHFYGPGLAPRLSAALSTGLKAFRAPESSFEPVRSR